MSTNNAKQSPTINESHALSDEQLSNIAGGGAQGGAVCPNCYSTDVVFDADKRIVLSCNHCGWKL